MPRRNEVAEVRALLVTRASEAKRRASARFFKTGPGQYGEGDVFMGVSVPDVRAVVRLHREASLATMATLLASEVHEERLTALLLMVDRFGRTKDGAEKQAVFELYMRSLDRVNNWDLVDSSAPFILGAWLASKSRRPLRSLARSPDIWSRRIAMLASFHFIKNGDFDDALALAEMLVSDEHDLIHKAVGWMLREMGARGGERELRSFLAQHARHMPRTMLRYAIEKFPEAERKKWLSAT